MSNAVATPVSLHEIGTLIRRLELEATQSDKTAALSIMESMLGAESEEELFERQEAGSISSKDFTLRPFRLLPEDISWKRSGTGYVEQGGFPFYALMRVTDMEDGTSKVVDSGAPSVISVLDKLLSWDHVDRPIEQRSFERFREDGGRPLQFVEKPVSSGYSVIMLRPVTMIESQPRRAKKS